ncbi:unnamed protein product [Mucor hiemalis]
MLITSYKELKKTLKTIPVIQVIITGRQQIRKFKDEEWTYEVLLDTVAIRQYFYLKTRERLLATEMYLKEAANLESINQEVELIEPERTINEDKLDEENILSDSDTENILSKNKEGPSSTDEG